MRDIVRIAIDSLLLGMASGIVVMVGLVVLDVGGLQSLVERVWMGGPAVLMIAVFAGMMLSSAQFIWRLVRLEMRHDLEDRLRRKLLISARRRRH